MLRLAQAMLLLILSISTLEKQLSVWVFRHLNKRIRALRRNEKEMLPKRIVNGTKRDGTIPKRQITVKVLCITSWIRNRSLWVYWAPIW